MFVDKQRRFLFKDHFLYSCSIKFDLNDTIFAYDYRARLACIMTLRQIVSYKLDPQHSYDTLWMS